MWNFCKLHCHFDEAIAGRGKSLSWQSILFGFLILIWLSGSLNVMMAAKSKSPLKFSSTLPSFADIP